MPLWCGFTPSQTPPGASRVLHFISKQVSRKKSNGILSQLRAACQLRIWRRSKGRALRETTVRREIQTRAPADCLVSQRGVCYPGSGDCAVRFLEPQVAHHARAVQKHEPVSRDKENSITVFPGIQTNEDARPNAPESVRPGFSGNVDC